MITILMVIILIVIVDIEIITILIATITVTVLVVIFHNLHRGSSLGVILSFEFGHGCHT